MPDRFIRECILRLRPYVPGKPIEEVERELGITDIVKMASNENPLGPSPSALAEMTRALNKVALYPDGSCYSLRKAVAKHWGVGEDQLIFGCGSDEIIHYIGLAFLTEGDETIQAHPTFVQYEACATLCDCKVHKVPLKNYTHDLEAMAERINARTKLIFIANPNNPTGTMNTRAEVEKLLSRVPERCLVVLDEAYYEYVERPDYPDALKLIAEGANVIALRTFSKIYGLAGLRIGYGIARPDIIKYLEQVRAPFNVNSIAQAGAIASLADPQQVARSRKVNSEGKRYLYREFDRLGLKYAPTEANFIFVDVGRDSVYVFKELLKRGVIVRTGDIFDMPTHIRVTIGTAEQNARFVKALEEVL